MSGNRLLIALWFLCVGVFVSWCYELTAAPLVCDQKCRTTQMFHNTQTGACGYLEKQDCQYCVAPGSCDKDRPGTNNACIEVSGTQILYQCSNCSPCGAIPLGAQFDECSCTQGNSLGEIDGPYKCND